MSILIAKISLETVESQRFNVTILRKNLKFKCQRCAALCCKLGGPPLTKKDIARIEKAGFSPDEFTEPASTQKYNPPQTMTNAMRDRADGSCVFLRAGGDSTYQCSIYDYRPALCRLYPFYVEMVKPHSISLKVTPCCRGLNVPDGEPINEDFIFKNLLETVIDLSEFLSHSR